MNNLNLRESDLTPKEESMINGGKNNSSKLPNLTTTTSSWTKLKDPRIVRVSRAFGGKDRHSKVCTVRGLRDRRVRLSVATAIQLYDLQHRLGLDQPSKVVDWLLDVAKHEIDELPPLQVPSWFPQDIQSMINWEDYCNLKKSKEKDHVFAQSSDQIMFNNAVPNLSLSQFGSYHRSMSSYQPEDTSHNFNINVSGSQLFMYPPVPSHDHNVSRYQFDDPNKQLNFELLSSSSSSSHNPLASSPLYTTNQGMIRRPFNLSMNSNSLSEENEQDNGN